MQSDGFLFISLYIGTSSYDRWYLTLAYLHTLQRNIFKITQIFRLYIVRYMKSFKQVFTLGITTSSNGLRIFPPTACLHTPLPLSYNYKTDKCHHRNENWTPCVHTLHTRQIWNRTPHAYGWCSIDPSYWVALTQYDVWFLNHSNNSLLDCHK